MKAASWEDVPLLLRPEDLRSYLGLSRGYSYELAHRLGRRLGRGLVIPKAALRAWLEKAPEAHSCE